MTEIKDFTSTDQGEVKDFTKIRKQVRFRIDGDLFQAAPAIPAEILAEFAIRYEGINDATNLRDTFNVLVSSLELVLLPESLALLQARLKDRRNPVDLDQLQDVITWLMSQYGMRPTRQSSNSSDGPPDQESGTSSTESTPPEASTSSPSLPIAS